MPALFTDDAMIWKVWAMFWCILIGQAYLGKVSRLPPRNRNMRRSVKRSSPHQLKFFARWGYEATRVVSLSLFFLCWSVITDVAVTFQGFPAEFAMYLNYCRGLRFEEAPDYMYLRQLFRILFRTLNHQYDYTFDWTLLKQKAAASASSSSTLPATGEYSN